MPGLQERLTNFARAARPARTLSLGENRPVPRIQSLGPAFGLDAGKSVAESDFPVVISLPAYGDASSGG